MLERRDEANHGNNRSDGSMLRKGDWMGVHERKRPMFLSWVGMPHRADQQYFVDYNLFVFRSMRATTHVLQSHHDLKLFELA